jgi:hypothetical protein
MAGNDPRGETSFGPVIPPAQFAERLNTLAHRLERSPKLQALDQDGAPRAWELAHGLLDLEESFRVVIQRLLPRLEQEELSAEQIEDLIQDVAEELRHVLSRQVGTTV